MRGSRPLVSIGQEAALHDVPVQAFTGFSLKPMKSVPRTETELLPPSRRCFPCSATRVMTIYCKRGCRMSLGVAVILSICLVAAKGLLHTGTDPIEFNTTLFDPGFVPDHFRVQVHRVARKCNALHDKFESPEGLIATHGLPAIEAFEWQRLGMGPWPEYVPYGCWFYFHASGSGVFIDVGKSLRASTRRDASRKLGLRCLDNMNCYIPGDILWCALALWQGYDSIQIWDSHSSHLKELVHCRGSCATQLNFVDTCPTGVNLTDVDGMPCNCSDSSGRLNCHGKENPGCQGDFTDPLCGHRIVPPFC